MNDASPALPFVAWRRLAPGVLLLAAVLLLFKDTAAAMVAIWTRSETFAHAFLVPPIVLWLVWRRRATLATLPLRPAPWVLLPMVAVAALWLLGELASVNAATQFALVAMLVLSVPAVFGWAVARELTFPLLFLFFAVPVGEFMVPSMMAWTADFTVAALQLSGVPVFREGLQFVIPSGNWSVVEACSGVRYLISSFMVGTLFAYLNYRSPKRRAIFMVLSLLMPVLANWVRAYLIVMLGHLSGNKLAAGVDHIIYGWVFFGIVIGGMFLIGARWSEPDAAAPSAAAVASAQARAQAQGRNFWLAPWGVGAGVLLLLLAVSAVELKLDHGGRSAQPAFALSATSAGGWSTAADPVSDWQPNYANASLDTHRSYQSQGRQAGVWVAYYRDQHSGRKLVTSTNTLVDQEAHSAWSQVESGQVAPAGLPAQALRTASLRGPGTAAAPQEQRLRVWQVYWVGDMLTTSDTRARLQIAIHRLVGRGDDGAALFFYTPLAAPDAAATAAADRVLESFVNAELPTLVRTLQAAQSAR